MSWYAFRRVAGFDIANAVFGLLPRRVSYVLITAVAWLVTTLFPSRVRHLRANLRRAFPAMADAELDRLVMANAKNYGKFWVDLFKIPRLSLKARNRLLKVDCIEYRDAVLAGGLGGLAISIHMGGWEGCTAFWREQECRTGLIAEVLEPPALWRRVKRLRQSNGIEMIPLSRTAPRHVLRILKENGLVAGARWIATSLAAGAPSTSSAPRPASPAAWSRWPSAPVRRCCPSSACASPTTPTASWASSRSQSVPSRARWSARLSACCACSRTGSGSTRTSGTSWSRCGAKAPAPALREAALEEAVG